MPSQQQHPATPPSLPGGSTPASRVNAGAAAVGIDDVGEVGVEVGAGPGGVGGVLGGGVPADAIMDRIVHNTIWIETGDVNMREHTATRGQLKPGR